MIEPRLSLFKPLFISSTFAIAIHCMQSVCLLEHVPNQIGVINYWLLLVNLCKSLLVLPPHLGNITLDLGDTQEAVKVLYTSVLIWLYVVDRMVHLHVFLSDFKKSLDVHKISIEDIFEEAFSDLSVLDVTFVLLATQEREKISLADLLVVVHVVEVECEHFKRMQVLAIVF